MIGKDKGLSLGGVDYITKLFSTVKLLAAVRLSQTGVKQNQQLMQ
jgi:DNA-binding response OmpR family regulator